MVCNKKALPNKLTLLFLLLISCSVILLLASTPPVSRDALIHHLAVPKLYLLHGSIYEIPNLVFSYYPMNLDFLYLIPLYFGNDIVPKYIHCLFGFASALLIFVFLRERLSVPYALHGALFFLTIPIIIKLSTTVYVDLGLIFFSLSSILLIISWLEKRQIHLLILSGLCCGLAIGTKYNGLIVFFILFLFVPFFYSRTTPKNKLSNIKVITYAIIFCSFVVLACGGWFLRNYLWTGNPIYPLYDNFFNPTVQTATSIENNQVIHSIFTMRHILYGETWWQMALLPIRLFFEGADNNARLFDGKLNPFLLILPLFAFVSPKADRKEKTENMFLASFSVIYFLFAFFSSALRIRYLSPIIPPLTILSMFGLRNIFYLIQTRLNNNRIAIVVPPMVIIAMLLPNFFYLYKQFKITEPLQYLTGQVNHETYVAKHRPEYATMAYANKHLTKNAKILCIFMGGRGYYLDIPHLFDDPENKSLLFKYIQEQSLTNTLAFLQEEKISHLLIREDLLLKTINALNDANTKRTWYNFFKTYTKLLYTSKGYSLYAIETSPSANKK